MTEPVTITATTLSAIERWLAVRAREGCPVEPERFATEAAHSLCGGLLGYVLDGHEPHEHPPPLAYSRPWHALIDAGGYEGPLEVWRLHAKWGADCGVPDAIVIAQSCWHLVETLGEEDWLVEWRSGGHDGPARLGTWRVTRAGEPEGKGWIPRWHLRPHREEAR